MKLRILGAAIAAAAVSLLTSAPASAVPVVTFEAQLDQGDFVWNPSTAQVSVGQQVAWSNPGGVRHTLKFYTGPWKNVPLITLNAGDSRAATPRRSALYSFYCTLHAELEVIGGQTVCTGMCGRLGVQAD